MQSVWDVQAWGSLIPNEIGLASSTFPVLFCPKNIGNEGGFADRNWYE